jgi:AcrR family transcriptional regulator
MNSGAIMSERPLPDPISIESILPDRGSPPQVRADALANRALILEVAAKLFARRGVADVSMADIAKEAGVGKGTLYRRFDNKGMLCLALMEKDLIRFQDIMLERMRAMTDEKVSPLTQLNQFLDALIHFMADNMPYWCEINREGVRPSDHSAPYFWLHMTVSGLLRLAVSAGELEPDTHIDLSADMILWTVSARAIRFFSDVRGQSLADISTVAQQLVSGLAR